MPTQNLRGLGRMDSGSRAALIVVLVCAVVVVALMLAWQRLQEAYIFAPVIGAPKPAANGVNEECVERLDMWVAEDTGLPPGAPVIIFFHGSFGNMQHSRSLIELLTCFKCHVVAFDYSGYGSSRGSPSTEQILEDGMNVFEYVRGRWPASEVILWGHSLGTSVATYVASLQPCRALVLMSPFYALAELGRDAGGFLWLAGTILSRLVNLLPTNTWIRRVTCPVAIIHSLGDRLISYRHALMLHEELLAARDGGDPDTARQSLLLLPTKGNHYCTLLSEAQLVKLVKFLGIRQRGDACLSLLEAAKNAPECVNW